MSDRYLVDNNALSRLTREQRTSPLFRGCCQITADVLYEARGYVDAELADLQHRLTPAALTRLIEVMATLQPGDTSLIDLYANKGAAEPVMVACAVEAQRAEDDRLVSDTWIIVTDDKAVAAMARQFGLRTLPSVDLRALLL